MGCLFEGFLELIMELLFESFIGFAASFICDLILRIFPSASKHEKGTRIVSIVLSVVLFLVYVIGFFLMFEKDTACKIAGGVMFGVPFVVYIIGFVVHIIKKRRNKQK